MSEGQLLLLVEDDVDQRRALQDVLLAWGYRTISVGLGKEALAQLEQREFSLVLLDLKLPDTDGFEVIRGLKRLHPELDFILITAYATVQNAVEAVNMGAFAYAIKPVDLDHLHNLIQRADERRQLREQVQRREQEIRATAQLQAKVLNERVLMLEEAGRKQDRLAHLYRAIITAQQTPDFEETARQLLLSLLQEMGAQYADLVMLSRDGTTERNVVQFLGVAPFKLPERVPGGLVDTLLKTHKSLYMPDMKVNPHANPHLMGAGMLSSFGVPLIIRGRVEGVLCFASTKAHAFDGDDSFPEAIASTCAIALERARLLDRVDRAKHEWETAFDAIGDGVVVIDNERTVLRANRAFAKLVGLPVEEVIRQKVCDLVHGKNNHTPLCPLERAMSTGNAEGLELQERHLGNRPLDVHVYPIPGRPGRFVHLFRPMDGNES